ncbi:MAG: hypothetical protein GEU87_06655 [Alphaproteobacteria bacterium]|nr:hypothetical protein [Alphaproteobacteria bacterium]
MLEDQVHALMDELPDDPNVALIEFRSRLLAMVADDDGDFVSDDGRWLYSLHIIEFLRNYDTDFKFDFSRTPASTRSPAFDNWFFTFKDELDRFAIRILQQKLRPPKPDPSKSIEFSADHKAEIRNCLSRIRAVVDQSDWTARKKDDVHEKISALQTAVEQTWTRMEAFMANFLDLSNVLGEGAKKMKPITDALESILEAAGKARASDNQARLEAPEERKQLPAPERVEGEAGSENEAATGS